MAKKLKWKHEGSWHIAMVLFDDCVFELHVLHEQPHRYYVSARGDNCCDLGRIESSGVRFSDVEDAEERCEIEFVKILEDYVKDTEERLREMSMWIEGYRDLYGE